MSRLETAYNGFISRISKVSRKYILYTLSGRVFLVFTGLILSALIILLAGYIFEPSSTVRKVVFLGYLSAVLAALAVIAALYFMDNTKSRKSEEVSRYAGRIGSFYPDIKDNLLNTIQLYSYSVKNNTIFSDQLVSQSIIDFDDRTKDYNFLNSVSPNGLKKSSLYFIAAAFLFIVLFFLFPSVFQSSAYSYINYNYTFIDNTLGIAFDVKPGNIEISKGDAVELITKISFNDPEYSADKIELHLNEVSADGTILAANSEKVEAAGRNEFKKLLAAVNSDINYWFEYRGIRSSSYSVKVSARPVIKSVNVSVNPPAYTKLPSRKIEGNEIVVIAGTQINIDALTSMDISRSSILFREGAPLNMQVNGEHSTASFTARNGSFRITLARISGDKELTNGNSPEFNIRVIPDEYPRISIIEPDAVLVLKSGNDVQVRSQIYDDFGFSKLRLGYRISKTKFGEADKDYRFIEIPVQNVNATGLEVPYAWDLSPLKLGTDDELEYFAEVFDNDAVLGPKSARSGIYKITLPSLDEVLNRTEKTLENLETQLDDAFRDAEDIKDELSNIKEQMQKNPEEMGLNDPAKNQQMQNKIENLQNKLSNTQQKLSDLMNDLKNNNQISQETLEKYMELQKLFSQIDSKELREALKKLQEALKNMNKDQLADAMKNFKFDEEAFKKAMEKTKELFEKIMNEQKLGQLTQKLDEITKNQEKLKEETGKTNENDKNKLNEQSKTQDNIKNDFQEFQKQLQQLQENMKKQNMDISKEMQKLLQQMQKKNIEQKMNQSSQELQKGNKEQSENKEQEISQDLQEMNQNMQDMLAQMLEQMNNPLQKKMQEFLDRLQKMSQQQKELMDKSEGLDKNSDKSEFDRQSKEQQELSNDLSNTIEDMMSMGQQMGMTPMMSKNLGDAFSKMNDASQQLKGKDGKSANQSQGEAKSNLDKAIEKMQSMCKNGKTPGKGSSLSQLLQGLQQLIQQQTQLNSKMNNMGLNGNEGKLSQEQMAQMQKLAMEQETIRKNLQQLNEEFKKNQDIEGKKMLGDLDQIQKDMQEMIRDMQNNNISPDTKKRQDKILSRLLDFQLSQREKDFEKKRESRPGKNFVRQSPPEIIISAPSLIDGINQDILDPAESSYSEDYELLIQKYLEKIRSQK